MTNNQRKPWNGFPTFTEPNEKPVEEKPQEFNTEYTDYPTCPHCGFVHEDYCDMTKDSEYDCDRCEKTFYCTSETDIKFCTGKVEEKKL